MDWPILQVFDFTGDETARFVYLLCLLVLVGAGFGAFRGRLPQALRAAGIWLLVGLGLVTLYAYRAPLERFAAPVLAVLDPSRAVEVVDGAGGRSVEVARGPDGHFHVEALVNGTSVDFLIDTGATGTVLTERDAGRAGIPLETLSFTRAVRTANGMTFEARVRLETFEIGPFRLRDVGAGVLPDDRLDGSLLGLNVLDRFASWRMENDRLILALDG